LVIDRPSILFFPRPHHHRLKASEEDGAELVCAKIEFGAGMVNPLIASLPGRQAAIDRLFEYVFVLLIRSAMDARLVDSGVLLGLSDSRLGEAIEAMHKRSETSWTLEELAQAARMSRARFAVYFRQVVGMTPFDYLTNWRLGVAQTMLRKGNSLKLIAATVGYANATALSRVFTQRVGMSPSAWLARN
jgi:transcriptional regulator GlxA family with amidase domain